MYKPCASALFLGGDNVITIKQYAKDKGVTYEAVRQQVVRYKKDLDGHVFKERRTQYLDDYAIDFLDKKRAENPIVIIEADKDAEIERLERENKRLLIKIAELQESLLIEKDQVKLLQQQKIDLLEQAKEEQSKGFFAKIFSK